MEGGPEELTSSPLFEEEGQGNEGSEMDEGIGTDNEVEDPIGKESETGIEKSVRKERFKDIHWNRAVYCERRCRRRW